MNHAALNLATNRASECPSCGENDLTSRGQLPDADFFAGRDLDPPLPGGILYACNSCALHFRWPRLTKEEADSLYSGGEEDNWDSAAEKRPDWQMAQEWISELKPGKSVLDIACFDGRFLSSLDDHHERYGIEIHPGAAGRARQSGVEIIANDFAELRGIERKFSVITAFDILEHTHAPHQFLASVADALEPGGLAIIGTGNTDAKSWQFMGPKYWYSSNIEHISFINPRWCEVVASTLNLDVARIARLSHCYPTITKICREATLNLLYRSAPHYSSLIQYRYRKLFRPHRRNSRNMQPAWFSAKDHLLVTFRKPISEDGRTFLQDHDQTCQANNRQAA
jgi:SAM-dependent methyltransferase